MWCGEQCACAELSVVVLPTSNCTCYESLSEYTLPDMARRCLLVQQCGKPSRPHWQYKCQRCLYKASTWSHHASMAVNRPRSTARTRTDLRADSDHTSDVTFCTAPHKHPLKSRIKQHSKQNTKTTSTVVCMPSASISPVITLSYSRLCPNTRIAIPKSPDNQPPIQLAFVQLAKASSR